MIIDVVQIKLYNQNITKFKKIKKEGTVHCNIAHGYERWLSMFLAMYQDSKSRGFRGNY